jgi:hypothetical protein
MVQYATFRDDDSGEVMHKRKQININITLTRCHRRVVSISASYSASPGFKSQLEDQLSS